ncbi:STM3941 family protein [Candidatus Riflebacteria bacterium]
MKFYISKIKLLVQVLICILFCLVIYWCLKEFDNRSIVGWVCLLFFGWAAFYKSSQFFVFVPVVIFSEKYLEDHRQGIKIPWDKIDSISIVRNGGKWGPRVMRVYAYDHDKYFKIPGVWPFNIFQRLAYPFSTKRPEIVIEFIELKPGFKEAYRYIKEKTLVDID